MRCYARDPAGGANSAPPDLLAGFWGEEREMQEKERANEEVRERKGSEREK